MRVAIGCCAVLVVLSGCGDEATDGGGGSGAASGTPTGPGSGPGSPTTGTSSGGGTLDKCTVFPADNPWNQDISGLDVHPSSDAFVDWIGRDTNLHPDFGSIYGIPYTTVPATQPKVPIAFEVPEESDPGPYPIPPDAPIEDGGDRHVLVVETDNCILYELYASEIVDGGTSWNAFSGAIWDLKTNATRPDGWTSADAAGLPVLPGLVRYDEVVEKGEIPHALRFTVSRSQAAYIPPATHEASDETDPAAPPMGLRFRMKASFDCSGFSTETQVICAGLKKYGMIVADNGSDWYISGATDARWNDEALNGVKEIPGDAFEAVYTGDPVTN